MSHTTGRLARKRGGIPFILAAGLTAAALAAALGHGNTAGAQELAGGKVKTKLDGSTLVVQGSSGNDAITLRLKAGDPNKLVVEVPSSPSSRQELDRAAFDSVRVVGGAGDDTITVDEENGVFSDTESLAFEGGAGNDTLLGGSGAETFTPGPGDDIVYAFAGADRIVWNAADGNDFIDGGDGADTVETNGNGDAEAFTAIANGARVRFDRVSPAASFLDIGGVESLVVNMKGGNDSFSAIGNLAALIALTVDGGSGDDTLLGSNGADVLTGAGGNDILDGNQGADSLVGGSGNDTIQWDPGDGSDVVEGQDGADTLQFNGSNIGEIFDVSANGARVRFTRNIANIVMDVAGVETLNVRMLGGADILTVNDLAGTGTKKVNANMAGFDGNGDAAADSVVLNGTDAADKVKMTSDDTSATASGLAVTVTVTGADASGDRFTVAGLGGDDVFDPNQMGVYPLQFIADGGAGAEKVVVNGTDAAESFTATSNGTSARLDRLSPTAMHFDVMNVESVVIKAGAGDDSFSATGNLAPLTAITVEGGLGNDTLLGSNGADVLNGGAGNDFIDGQQGNDTILMGGDDDTFQWDPGDGSDVVEGQGGNDTMVFNGSNIGEIMDISANGGRVRFTRNIANIVMDLNGIENVRVNTFGGNDVVTVNPLAGTGLRSVKVNLAQFDGSGDSSPDTVVVNATNATEAIAVSGTQGSGAVTGLYMQVEVTVGESALDRIAVNAFGGDDVVDATGLDATTVSVAIDGGDGDDLLLGGAGNDLILGGNGDDVLIGGPGQDALDGGPGGNVVIQD